MATDFIDFIGAMFIGYSSLAEVETFKISELWELSRQASRLQILRLQPGTAAHQRRDNAVVIGHDCGKISARHASPAKNQLSRHRTHH